MSLEYDVGLGLAENDLGNAADVLVVVHLPVGCQGITILVDRKNLQGQIKQNLNFSNGIYILTSLDFVQGTKGKAYMYIYSI